MKFIFTLLTILTGGLLFMASCTDNDVTNNTSYKPVEPGIYYVDMSLYAEATATKGVADNNRFDRNYDYDYIYLHKITTDGEDKSIRMPVWNCPECGENGKGIRYRICTFENGTYQITPINENDEYVDDIMEGNIENDKFYFSSWSTDEWALSTEGDQISEGTVNEENTNLFHRKKNVNQEIYRSEEGKEYGLNDLKDETETTITIVRACAGFSVGGLFYNPDNKDDSDEEDITYDITPDQFKNVMGSSYDEWYIKIYIGGKSFSNQHNIATGKSTGNQTGYYSSGDGAKYSEEDIDTQKYLPFTKRTYKAGTTSYKGYGYYTKTAEETEMGNIGNYLFTPVTGEEVTVYILIKHWTQAQDPEGRKENPSEEWLNNDEGAMQTTVTLSEDAVNPQNGHYYTIGLVTNINQFKAAWDDSGGDNWQQGTSAVSTKSPSGATVREFTLKDAIVICDVY